MVAKNNPNEIYISRVYRAPLSVVWDAWNDPEQAAQWWGPRGFTLTTHSKDLRPGGIWHYTMHGPDGTDYINKTLYHVVEHHQQLVYDHGGNDERAPLFRVTVNFSEADGQTRMEMTMALPTAEQAAATRKFVKAAGGNGTWDRLAEYLDLQLRGEEIFVMHRSFDFPLAQLNEMWPQPEQLSHWLQPNFNAFQISASTPGSSLTGTLKLDISGTESLPTILEFRSETDDSSCVNIVSQLPARDTNQESLQPLRADLSRRWTAALDKLES